MESFARPGGRRRYVKRDLLGFADGIVLLPRTTIALQWTDTTSVGKHVTKILGLGTAYAAAEAGWRILVWGFDPKTGKLREVDVGEQLLRKSSGTTPPAG